MRWEPHDGLIAVILVAVVLLTGFQVVSAATSGEMQEYTQESEEWCDARNGELYNSMSVIHGGLHCQLPNGTSVHMHEVIEDEG